MREYGLPNPTPADGAVPQWKATELACPACGGLLCEVTLKVTMPHLRGGRGVSTYLGCPACPYASPSMSRSLTPSESTPNPVGSD
jgi:C4-type Zn-finger protein